MTGAGARWGLGRSPPCRWRLRARRQQNAAAWCRASRIDPIAARNAQRQLPRIDAAKALTFRRCAEACIAGHKTRWRDAKHRAQWSSTLDPSL
jgi:hypothetical protein